MTHEEIKGSLSAYADGQLVPEKTDEISGHLSGCGECRAALSELKALSIGIKANLGACAPPGIKERLLDNARGAKRPLFRSSTALAAAAVIILALMAGVAAKRFMPAMFAQIQGMISAASGTLGSSGDNK